MLTRAQACIKMTTLHVHITWASLALKMNTVFLLHNAPGWVKPPSDWGMSGHVARRATPIQHSTAGRSTRLALTPVSCSRTKQYAGEKEKKNPTLRWPVTMVTTHPYPVRTKERSRSPTPACSSGPMVTLCAVRTLKWSPLVRLSVHHHGY